MRDDITTQGVLFTGLFERLLSARFDQPDMSSDGGAVLLSACDKRLGLIGAMAGSLRHERRGDRVIHDVRELVEQRVYGMACGYEDCNGSARLAGDPMHRLLLGRDPREGEWLASQPTLSRFERSANRW